MDRYCPICQKICTGNCADISDYDLETDDDDRDSDSYTDIIDTSRSTGGTIRELFVDQPY